MQLLSEEIEEKSKDGEILLAMDANAKIGLLNETISRNGKLFLDIFKQYNLTVMNNTSKCAGRITRQNTAISEEVSAIDFIIANNIVEKWISEIIIDEDGLLKVKGKKETDHNTILVKMKIESIEKIKPVKNIGWNLKAPEEKWRQFEQNLRNRYKKATDIIMNEDMNIEERYNKWFHELDSAARESIGKTTFNVNSRKNKVSKKAREIQKEKRTIKSLLKDESDKQTRYLLIGQYKKLQEESRDLVIEEQTEQTKLKFEKILNDKTGQAFWKMKKNLSRDPTLDMLTVKNSKGERQFTPEGIKETMANYYENLYKEKEFPHHPYHNEVTVNNNNNITNKQYDNDYYNREPTIEEIEQIIRNKKNGKSAPDIKNEMIKKPGETMVYFLYPLIKSIWRLEEIPSRWNTGAITSIWKGKGDREDPSNHRGITTSSAIGTIVDTLIDNRISRVVPFTEAQGGGKKGAMTCNHLFILRAIISISLKKDQHL